MREPNLSFPAQSRAAVCITSALYDRRALDCTATLPLINSLTHLAYLTSTSPRIREILVLDGGLERLVRILSPQHQYTDRRSLWKWSLAFQCIVNVGVRGTEQIRTKVVEAGTIPIVLRVLENFLKALELVRQDKRGDSASLLRRTAFHADTMTNNHSLLATTAPQTVFSPSSNLESASSCTTTTSSSNTSTTAASSSSSSSSSSPSSSSSIPSSHADSASRPQRTTTSSVIRRSTFPYVKMDPAQRRRNRVNRETSRSVSTWQDPRVPHIDNIFYREEDILLSLQLLAYLSKYPHIRNLFHTAYDRNVFSVVEKFCHRLHPNAIQYWAGVIMRNACRKDETRGGTRRCANMACGKWETQPREFAKCRRCRKAKYCSKDCQSKAWTDGHRWWCVERHATAPREGEQGESTRPSATSVPSASQQVMADAPAESSDSATDSNNDHQRSNAIVVSNLPSSLSSHGHSDMTMIEQDLGDRTQPGSAERSESRGLIMDMGVHMEL
ncbi:uncharacterized protein BYT42DRAFT_613243 [Radiomyces spectabilis]|uniref:uncharacterized protein n=1 Tax=Radiomyces spectabilis TaxID=64574 RepID=UPI00221FF34B|nr:uncharacterized protein BYT42DRAFT_613243 [Radiomyces spectabilis]KAI8381467.1 hypothetical protein BYT42DRAFT_613243 [Radiomyces spectabilis]